MESFRDLVESMENDEEREPSISPKKEPDIVDEHEISVNRSHINLAPLCADKTAIARWKQMKGEISCTRGKTDTNFWPATQREMERTGVRDEKGLKLATRRRKDIGIRPSGNRSGVKNTAITSESIRNDQQSESEVQNHCNKHASGCVRANTHRSLATSHRPSLKEFEGQKRHGIHVIHQNQIHDIPRVSGRTYADSNIPKASSAYRCKQCPIDVQNGGTTGQHCRRHNPKRPFGCDQCPSRFNQLVHLQIHLRTHTGEKPFVCHVCGARFSRKDRLRSHQRIHTGEKPYSCPHCESYFRDTVCLKEHLKLHIEEKPNICRICRASFANLTTFTTHWRMHKTVQKHDNNPKHTDLS